jgi:ATP sulfurylase
MDRMDEMENKMHDREKFTVPVASYATAAAQNAGRGGTVKFINSEDPMALMDVEQERLNERRLNIIVRGVKEHPNPEEAAWFHKEGAQRQAGRDHSKYQGTQIPHQ